MFVAADDIFREVVFNFQKRTEFSFYDRPICKQVRDLNIDFLPSFQADEINFIISDLTDMDLISTGEHFDKYNIFV